MFPFRELCCRIENISALRTGRNSCYRSADILVRLGLANAAEADKNVRALFAFLHVLGNGELRP